MKSNLKVPLSSIK